MRPYSWILWSLAATSALAEERPPASSFSAGDATVFDESRLAYSRALPGIDFGVRRHHSTGNSFFNENWIAAPGSASARDGLGPLFNARSCSACHHLDGRGRPPEEGVDSVSLLFRISIQHADGTTGPHPVYGDQIQPKALPGVEPEVDVELEWQEEQGTYPDGSPWKLRKPSVTFANWRYGAPNTPLLVSPRIAMAVHGLGLLEAIPETDIRALADPEDTDGNGISGRPNEVPDKDSGSVALGRFGWKANQPSLRQQAADAFLGDIGITTTLNPDEAIGDGPQAKLHDLPSGGNPELEEHLLDRVTTYLQTLAVPARRDVEDPRVLQGERLFEEVRCTDCHIPTFRTARSAAISQLEDEEIHPYTDLLLHDMGDGLADGRPDHLATDNEWRTPPLWGLGLLETVNGHTTLLHDGRARDTEEAILWHGGEAQASRDLFTRLSMNDRKALLAFLASL